MTTRFCTKRKVFLSALCNELRSRYAGRLRFHTPNGLHVREIDEECALMLKETGFRTIRLSLESIDPKIARQVRARSQGIVLKDSKTSA